MQNEVHVYLILFVENIALPKRQKYPEFDGHEKNIRLQLGQDVYFLMQARIL